MSELARWAETAREVEQAIRGVEDVDGETWANADWLASELERVADESPGSGLEAALRALRLPSGKPPAPGQATAWTERAVVHVTTTRGER
jgi:hypothetical protein